MHDYNKTETGSQIWEPTNGRQWEERRGRGEARQRPVGREKGMGRGEAEVGD